MHVFITNGLFSGLIIRVLLGRGRAWFHYNESYMQRQHKSKMASCMTFVWVTTERKTLIDHISSPKKEDYSGALTH